MRAAGLAMALILAGCWTDHNYDGIPWQISGGFRVRDNTYSQHLMIEPDRMRQSLLATGTLGLPKSTMEDAAQQYLSHKGCRVIDIYPVQNPAWEVKYDCQR